MSKYIKIVCIKSTPSLTLNKIYLFKKTTVKIMISDKNALLIYDKNYNFIGVFSRKNFKTLKQLRQEKTDFLLNKK